MRQSMSEDKLDTFASTAPSSVPRLSSCQPCAEHHRWRRSTRVRHKKSSRKCRRSTALSSVVVANMTRGVGPASRTAMVVGIFAPLAVRCTNGLFSIKPHIKRPQKQREALLAVILWRSPANDSSANVIRQMFLG